MISYQWSGRPDPDGNTYQFYKTSPGVSLELVGHLESADRRHPRQDAARPRSQADRKKLFSELARLLQEELPMLFIVHPIEPKAFSPRVQGYDPVPDGMMRFREVWLK